MTLSAMAGGVTASAGGITSLGLGIGPDASGGVGAEIRLGPVFSSVFQVELEGGIFPGDVYLPRLNLQLTSAREAVVRPTFGGGGGVLITDSLTPLVHIGPGLSVRLTDHLDLHTDARYLLALGSERLSDRSGGELTAGLTWRWLREAQPEPVVEAESVEQPPEASLTVTPADARIWLPHPECAWLSVSDFARAGLRIESDVTLRVSADGYLPREIVYTPGMSIALEPAPSQGTLVVVGSPGDTVRLGKRKVSVDEDGVAVISAEIGRVQLSVSGGGRELNYRTMVSNGHATWLRVTPPIPTQITFGSNSSIVLAEDVAGLRDLARELGDYHLTLQGAYSPEGAVEHNLQLAQQRAESVAEILRGEGVPEERLHFLDPAVPHEDDPLHKQRYVLVEPTGAAP